MEMTSHLIVLCTQSSGRSSPMKKRESGVKRPRHPQLLLHRLLLHRLLLLLLLHQALSSTCCEKHHASPAQPM